MDEKYRKNIGAFIAYHNIIRPIEYPLFGLIFISALMMIIYFLIFPLDRSVSLVASQIGLLVSTILLIINIVIRKKVLNLKNVKIGESLYIAQMFLYIYCAATGLILHLEIVTLEFGINKGIYSTGIVFGVSCMAVLIAFLLVKKGITSGRYLHNKNTTEKLIAFSSSTVAVVMYVIAFQIIKRTFNGIGYAILTNLLVEISLVLAFLYFLKLQYARIYGLEEFLPQKPHPSAYTDWE